MLREQTALVERATERLVEQLLPVLDAFELRARAASTRDAERRRCARASSSSYAELVGGARAAGLERIDADGAPFDPNEHEAVMQDDGDGEPHVGEIDAHRLPAQGPRAAARDGEGARGED